MPELDPGIHDPAAIAERASADNPSDTNVLTGCVRPR